MFDRPEWLWLLAALPLIAWPAWLAITSGHLWAGSVSGVLRVASFMLIVAMLAGTRLPWRGSADHLELAIALDQSRSITPDQRTWMLRQVAQIRRAMSERDRLALLAFGRDAYPLARLANPRTLSPNGGKVDGDGTDLAGAMVAAAGMFDSSAAADRRVLLLSDGNQTDGDALAEARNLAAAGIEVSAATPPPPAQPRVAISSFDAPASIRANTSFDFHLDVESEAQTPQAAFLRLSVDGREVGARALALNPGLNHFELPFRIARPGAYLMKVNVAASPPAVTINSDAEAAVTVGDSPKVLIIAGNGTDSLSGLLKLRGFQVASTAPRALPTDPFDYLGYQAVIISDTPAAALDESVQRALAHYVSDLGGGLVVVGDTLRDDRFHDSPLETVLPVEFVPQPPPPSREPIAIYLLIDRSNSMSYDSREPALRDGERIRYAKQAAVALLNQLDDTDYAGVIAFDSDPYVLGHLQPLGRDREQLLQEVERLEPGGGTDFKEALEIAKREILESGIPVRQVILLTDGDTNRQYHDHDQLMQDFAREQVPVSTIRIGPDLENLRLLQDFAAATGGTFYRVEDITKLPQLLVHLTHEAQNVKFRKHTSVVMTAPTSILDGIDPRQIPPVDYFAVTRAKDDASVALVAHRGTQSAPLLAAWQYALGRTAIVSADPDSIGSLAWLRWNHYAEFWSQLVDWVARQGDPGPFNLRLQPDSRGGLRIEAQAVTPGPVADLFCRISNGSQAQDVALNQVGATTYRGEIAPLSRGSYQVALMIKTRDTERLLLQRPFASVGAPRADTAELELKPPNVALLRDLCRVSGGSFQPTTDLLLRPKGRTTLVWMPIGEAIPPLAIALLLMDVWVRRRFLAS